MKHKHDWFSPSFDLIDKEQFQRICKASLLDSQGTETCTIFHPQIHSALTLQVSVGNYQCVSYVQFPQLFLLPCYIVHPYTSSVMGQKVQAVKLDL